MKLIIFDVNNAACSLAVCPNGYSMMVVSVLYDNKVLMITSFDVRKQHFIEKTHPFHINTKY